MSAADLKCNPGFSLTRELPIFKQDIHQTKESVAELQKVTVSLQQKLEETVAIVLALQEETAELRRKQILLEKSLQEKDVAIASLSHSHAQLMTDFTAHKSESWISRLTGQK
jgi:hypothetical protein